MDKEDRVERTRSPERFCTPVCSVSENDGIVTAKLEMPGVPKEGLEIKISGNELSIIGMREDPQEEGNYLLKERRGHPYRKLFTIDETISRENIDASLADGILTLNLHQKEAAKPRRIEIA